MARNGPDARKASEWWKAHQFYSQLYPPHSVFSIVGVGFMPGPEAEEIDQELKNILDGCPVYFHAWFQRGENMLRIGRNSEGEGFIEKAFNYMVEILEDEEEFKQTLSHRMENLEKLLRYDLAAKYMEKATRIFPNTADYYDDLAFYILQLTKRHKTEALRMQEKALEIEPDNDYFINNLGWVHLMMGNFREAERYFQKAMEFNPDNPGAFKNMDTLEYMAKHRLNYFEYLVRPADMKELNELLGDGEFEEVAGLCREYNIDRKDAFKIHCLKKNTLPPHEILNTLQPFETFMNEAEKIAEGKIFLYENIDLLYKELKSFVYQFITGCDYIEEPLLHDLSRSLTVFYNFLHEAKLVTQSQYKLLIERIRFLIAEFSRKAGEYNRIRQDVNLEEAERGKAIEELFGLHHML